MITQATKETLTKLVNDQLFFKDLIYLRNRWAHESKYEDWSDYEKRISHHLDKHGLTFVRGTKRPFGAIFRIGGSAQLLKVCLQKKGEYITLITSTAPKG